MATWKNRARILDVLKRLPSGVKDEIGAQLKIEVDGLTEAIKRHAPVGVAQERTPGELRDSVHNYPGRRELQHVVLADAKDPQGRFIGQHVEFGHMAKGGVHVPASPFFFPTYRARKRQMRAAMRAALKRAAQAWAPELVK